MGVTPVPIPNTEVKTQRAYGTAGTVRGRVGPRQGYFKKNRVIPLSEWPGLFLYPALLIDHFLQVLVGVQKKLWP